MTLTNPPSRQAFDNLVQFAHSLRPDWQAPGIAAGIRAALNREERFDLAALVGALVRAASDPAARTPHAMTLDAYWSRSTAGKVHAEGEGDPRYVCGICSMTEDACRARAATNGHLFLSRLEALRLARPAKDDVR